MLELYQAENCPWCVLVRDKLMELGISYIVHNPRLTSNRGRTVTNQQSYDSMMKIGGVDQVPFLVDPEADTFLYESYDIIAYLDEHYGS